MKVIFFKKIPKNFESKVQKYKTKNIFQVSINRVKVFLLK